MTRICKSVGSTFLRTIKDDTLEFPLVIAEIRISLEPVFDAIINELEWQQKWDSRTSSWLNPYMR